MREAKVLEAAEPLAEAARSAISAEGRRLTAQRIALLEILQESGEHLDAEEIHRRARDRGEKVSLATVYRTLDLLKRLNLVDELHLWDEHHHYESRTPQGHCHLVCRVCGGVTEISGAVVKRMRALASEPHGFAIERGQMDFVGTCRRCRDGGQQDVQDGQDVSSS